MGKYRSYHLKTSFLNYELGISMDRNFPVIKLYGERNTGTNYLSQLLELNLEVTLLPGTIPNWLQPFIPRLEWPRDMYFSLTFSRNLGWKHRIAPSPHELAKFRGAGPVYFLTVTKNPYSWLLSLYRRPYHNYTHKGSFEEFLQRPWPTVRREGHPTPFENPVIVWNEKNRSYLNLGQYASCLNLRYEDLLSDPKETVERIAVHFNISKKSCYFQNVTESTKGDSRTFSQYQEYYIQEKWREKLSPQAIDIINRYVDTQLMSHFGYSLISAS